MDDSQTVADKPVNFNETDKAALAESERAGLTRPSAISGTETPTLDSLHMRLQALEAIVTHVIETYHPSMKLDAVLDEWKTRTEGPSETVDHRAFAR